VLILVHVIDWFVEWVKYLGGAPGHRNVGARIFAWLFLLVVIAAVVAVIAAVVWAIPGLVDLLNGK
jgi:hypothetical protein